MKNIYIVYCPGSGNAGCMDLPITTIVMAYTTRKAAEKEKKNILTQLDLLFGAKDYYQVDIYRVPLYTSGNNMFTQFEGIEFKENG